ncbi:MAG: gamma carbonic anhydrase family protein [Desulfobacteraceae bacterium]|nr:MAG: gamma carbonic anhydrase family protein [Desulfobacteraceae bacterium]
MAVYEYDGQVPMIGRNCYISDSARVIGNVTVHDQCYIGHGAVIRGDYGQIVIGPGSAIEENAVLHIRPKGLLELEDSVTVGHSATIHGRLIRSHAVIGMGSVVSFDARVGRWSIVAEGAVVPGSTTIPDEEVVAGIPCRRIGAVTTEHKAFWTYGKKLYTDLAKDYDQKLKRIA